MALEKIVFKLVVDDSGNAVKLKATQKGYKDIDLTVRNAEKSANQLNTAISKTGSGANIKSIKITQKEYEKLAKTQNQVKNASGSASSSVLELGRAISDSNYGIQGMANNLSQLSSNLLFTVKSAGGLTGGLKALKSAFLGPLGLIVAFQTVIMLIERFSMRQQEATSGAEAFKVEIEELMAVQKEYGATLEDVIGLTKARTDNASKQIEIDEKLADVANELEEAEKQLSIARKLSTNQLLKKSQVDGMAIRAQKEINKLSEEQTSLLNEKIKSETAYQKVRKEFIESNNENIVGLKKIIDLYKKERDEVSDNDAYKEKTKIIESYEEKIRDITGALSDYEKALRKIRTMEADDKASALEEITQAESDYIDSLGTEYEQEVRLIESKYFRLIELAKRYGYDTSMLEKARQKEIDDIEIKGTKKTRERVNRIFKEQVLDLQKFISQTNREAELETEMSAERRLRIEFEYSKADLLLQKTTFVEKQKLRFKQYTEAEAKRQKMSIEEFKKTEQYANEKAKLQQSIDNAEISHQEAHNALILLNEQKMFSARLDALKDFNNRIDKLNLSIAKNTQGFNKSSLGGVSAGSVGSPMSTVGAESVDTQVSDAEDYNELLRSQFEDDIVQKEIELRAKFDSEMQIQAELSKMRYNFNLEEMNREIELEQMKIDAKKNINQEYISWVSGLGSVMRNLAGENEEIAKLALIIEKGAEIADIVIKTQSANAQVSAIASVRATAGDVSAIPEAKTRILKNNIGSGIAIANILATTLKSQKKPSGSGSAGAGASGGGGRTFDFNLVGSTGENQLAQGIAGQLGNPVQAYVVSSQMTSQQQLDNAIQTSATIGD